MLSLTARRRLVRSRTGRSRHDCPKWVCGASRPVAESTGDMPISAVSASCGLAMAAIAQAAPGARSEPPFPDNRSWEVDRVVLAQASERRAWLLELRDLVHL